jgi:hypothetical protein
MFFQDPTFPIPDPVFRVKKVPVPDPRSGSAIKNLSIFNPKIDAKPMNMQYDPGC